MLKIIPILLFIACASHQAPLPVVFPAEPTYQKEPKTKNDPWAYECNRKISKCINNDDVKIIKEKVRTLQSNFEQCEFNRCLLKNSLQPEDQILCTEQIP